MTNQLTSYATDNEKDNDLFLNAFTHAAIGMALVAPNGKWLKVNDALCAMLDYSPEELLAKSFQDITHPDDLERDIEFVNMMLAGDIETYQMEKRYFHKDGHIIDVLLSVSLVVDRDNHPHFFISQLQDITRRKQLEEQLKCLSQEDSLTKVANRRHFIEHATREIIRGNRFHEPQALMIIDIDHFKKVNDAFGHDIGDVVLKAMATECRSALRDVDVFGRLGGEEFGVLLINADSDIANRLADRIVKRIEALNVHTHKGAINFTVSIGMVTFIGGGKSLESRLQMADTALYRAKEQGRNRTVTIDDTPEEYHIHADTAHSSLIHLQWDASYESGNRTIDIQHRKLFSIANNLLSKIVTGAPDPEVTAIAIDLINHTKIHFRDEYQIISECGYPDADQHARIHASLIEDMQHIVNQFSSGEKSVGALFELLAVKVVSEHLLHEDRSYYPHLTQNQNNTSN